MFSREPDRDARATTARGLRGAVRPASGRGRRACMLDASCAGTRRVERPLLVVVDLGFAARGCRRARGRVSRSAAVGDRAETADARRRGAGCAWCREYREAYASGDRARGRRDGWHRHLSRSRCTGWSRRRRLRSPGERALRRPGSVFAAYDYDWPPVVDQARRGLRGAISSAAPRLQSVAAQSSAGGDRWPKHGRLRRRHDARAGRFGILPRARCSLGNGENAERVGRVHARSLGLPVADGSNAKGWKRLQIDELEAVARRVLEDRTVPFCSAIACASACAEVTRDGLNEFTPRETPHPSHPMNMRPMRRVLLVVLAALVLAAPAAAQHKPKHHKHKQWHIPGRAGCAHCRVGDDQAGRSHVDLLARRRRQRRSSATVGHKVRSHATTASSSASRRLSPGRLSALISALSPASVTVTNDDGTVTCTLGDGSPKLGDYRVGDRVKLSCAEGVLTAIAKLTPPADVQTGAGTLGAQRRIGNRPHRQPRPHLFTRRAFAGARRLPGRRRE